MPVIPFPEWRPDLADMSNATDIALNVFPRTAQSYGPFNGLNSYSSNALDGPCIGAIASEAIGGTISVWAGTTDKLYQMTALSTAWNDVSVLGGYSTATGDVWHFAYYNNYIFTTNFAQPIQFFLQGTSTLFAELSVDAPNARYMCTPKNFLMVGNTFDPVGGLNPARIWWSASGDPLSWPAPGSALAQQDQSDFNDFQGSFGRITGMVDSLAGADVAIFFERAVWRGVYVGPPDVFDFFPAENVRGCVCPNSIVAVGNLVYYRGVDGFYAFDGAQSQGIGVDKFDQWFQENVNPAFLWNVVGAADPLNRAILWIFPSLLSSSGIPDTILIYRWDIQRGTYCQLSAEWLTRLLSFGVTLDTFGALGFNNLDTIPYSLDSRVWVGGAIQLGAVDANHKLAYFSGPTLAAQIATSTVQATPGKLSWVSGARPMVQLTTGTPTIAIAGRNNVYDPIVYGADIPPNSMGDCPQRSDARYQSALLKIPANSAWTHATGVDIDAQPSGER